MGKSSIIQSLLLLKQSYDKGHLRSGGLTLKGELSNIGVGRDAIFRGGEVESIRFGISFLAKEKSVDFMWAFGYEADSDVLPFDSAFVIPDGIDELPIFKNNLKYLNAERTVRNQYERSDFHVVTNRSLGMHGEYTAHYLAQFGNKKSEEVHDSVALPNAPSKNLDHQVSAWMGEVSPGTKVIATKIAGVDGVKLGYEFENASGKSEEFSPTNVGFGITYSLPVIVLLLSAKPGDILLIENPESHVHPRGQSMIGRLMGRVAQTGVQIFVESHSDHILNGICLAIHDGHIKKEAVKIYFLQKNKNETQTSKYEVEVNDKGVYDDQVLRDKDIEGFFDQANKDNRNILFG